MYGLYNSYIFQSGKTIDSDTESTNCLSGIGSESDNWSYLCLLIQRFFFYVMASGEVSEGRIAQPPIGQFCLPRSEMMIVCLVV